MHCQEVIANADRVMVGDLNRFIENSTINRQTRPAAYDGMLTTYKEIDR